MGLVYVFENYSRYSLLLLSCGRPLLCCHSLQVVVVGVGCLVVLSSSEPGDGAEPPKVQKMLAPQQGFHDGH